MAVARDTTTVRVSRTTHARLRALAAQNGEPLTEVLDRAVEQEERRQFWRQFHEAVERLRADPQRWTAYRAESADLGGTVLDGLEPDEDWQFLAEARPEEIEFLEPQYGADAKPR